MCEAAAFYYERAARWSHRLFHKPGNEPLGERQRLSPDTESVVDQGERGDDDSQIEYVSIAARLAIFLPRPKQMVTSS